MSNVTTSGVSNDTRALMAFEAGKKSMAVSYLLWLFLGGFGAHRFYLGQTGTAVAMLVLSIVGVLTAIVGVGFLLLIPVWIWLLVDAFLIPGYVKSHNQRLLAQLGV